MHIYNWYHSNITGIHYVHEYRLRYTRRNPLAFISPCRFPFAPLSNPPLLTWNPLRCDRIRPPWSQVACKLTSPSSTLSPIPPHLQIPRTQVIKCLTMTTSRLQLLLSGTDMTNKQQEKVPGQTGTYMDSVGRFK